jgi:predicted permease
LHSIPPYPFQWYAFHEFDQERRRRRFEETDFDQDNHLAGRSAFRALVVLLGLFGCLQASACAVLGPILAAVIPVLVTAGLGFLWVRSGRPFENGMFTPLVVDIGTPCLIFATFVKTSIPAADFASIALASTTAIACFGLVAAIFLPLAGLRVRTFLPSLTFPNNGNLGLPLAAYAFGEQGLGYAIVFYAICMIGQFTVGQAIAAGTANWRGMLRLPLVYAVLLGVGVSIWHVPLPTWLTNTIALIGGMTIPLMLLMLGASLARLQVVTMSRAVVLSLLRIGLGASIGVVIAFPFHLETVARSVLVMQCAMPVAVYNYLFAQKWNNPPEEVASLVVMSTCASVLTVPALLHFLMF